MDWVYVHRVVGVVSSLSGALLRVLCCWICEPVSCRRTRVKSSDIRLVIAGSHRPNGFKKYWGAGLKTTPIARSKSRRSLQFTLTSEYLGCRRMTVSEKI